MNPQGRFQSVTHLPKPISIKILTGFPAPTTIQVPISLLSSLHNLREWIPTLLYYTVPHEFLLLLGLQCGWSRISMLGFSGLTYVRKVGHRPKHLRYAGLVHSWISPTISIANKTVVVIQ
jgi:hypothetical protein